MTRRFLAGGSHWRVSPVNDLDLMIVLMHVGFILKTEPEGLVMPREPVRRSISFCNSLCDLHTCISLMLI